MATGRSDYPNQINNVLCFPGLFKGALRCRARGISEGMKLAAAHAIADLVADDELSEENIIPPVFARRVADAVERVAREEGLARPVLDGAPLPSALTPHHPFFENKSKNRWTLFLAYASYKSCQDPRSSDASNTA